MGLRSTYRPTLGPFVFNTGHQGLTSISFAAGPIRFCLWSRNRKAGLSSVDLPGPISYRPTPTKRGQKTSTHQRSAPQSSPQRPQQPAPHRTDTARDRGAIRRHPIRALLLTVLIAYVIINFWQSILAIGLPLAILASPLIVVFLIIRRIIRSRR